jgi:hypothetical protein
MPAKFDRCVKSVEKQGSKYNPYAVCTNSIYGKSKKVGDIIQEGDKSYIIVDTLKTIYKVRRFYPKTQQVGYNITNIKRK